MWSDISFMFADYCRPSEQYGIFEESWAWLLILLYSSLVRKRFARFRISFNIQTYNELTGPFFLHFPGPSSTSRVLDPLLQSRSRGPHRLNSVAPYQSIDIKGSRGVGHIGVCVNTGGGCESESKFEETTRQTKHTQVRGNGH